ncbi:MAG: 50S ribosomal protein L3 [Phycisphaeraceae bacterium]|nr:50S ribosomal protein L3 [Phycisphaeraceae bacterium]
MPATLLGKKIGMTRLFLTQESEGGQVVNNVPVTVIQVGPCFVSQIKSEATDGYNAVQVAFDEVKPRNSTQPIIGHDARAGISPQRVHREFRVSAEEAGQFQLGQQITLDSLEGTKYIDVIGTSKGKGFQGVMKRHHFKGLCASHGTERKHRSPGSIASHATNRGFSGRPKKGLRMPGHMGDDRVTMRSLEIVGTDKEKNLLLVKGPVPGANQGVVVIRAAKRLYKRKANALKAS